MVGQNVPFKDLVVGKFYYICRNCLSPMSAFKFNGFKQKFGYGSPEADFQGFEDFCGPSSFYYEYLPNQDI